MVLRIVSEVERVMHMKLLDSNSHELVEMRRLLKLYTGIYVYLRAVKWAAHGRSLDAGSHERLPLAPHSSELPS